MNLTEFKIFAESKDGLQLKHCDVETICYDNRYSLVEIKNQMLNKWKEKQGEINIYLIYRSVAELPGITE